MCLRAMVMAYYDSGFDNTKPVDGDGLHCPTVRAALEPFCGQRRKPFRGPEDAIQVLGPIAEQVSSRDRMETFFPPEFAGCLHDSTTLKARLPRFAELAELLKEALRLWLEAINCERFAFLRQRIEEVIEDHRTKHTTYKGAAFVQGAYLLEASEVFLKRTGRLLNS